LTDIPPIRPRLDGSHRGTFVIRNVDTIDVALAKAREWIGEYLDGRDHLLYSESEPVILALGDGEMRVVGWDVTITWAVKP